MLSLAQGAEGVRARTPLMLELQAQLLYDGAHLDIDGITEQLVPLPLVAVVIGGAEVPLRLNHPSLRRDDGGLGVRPCAQL